MENKRFWLGMLVMALAFGMMVVGCEPEPEDEEEPSGLEGPLYGLKFDGVQKLNEWELSRIPQASRDAVKPEIDGDLECLDTVGGSVSSSYSYAIVIGGEWYKQDLHFNWHFGRSGKKMEKWEYVSGKPILREEKPFEYVNNEQHDEIKIDGNVYKYKLEPSKGKDYVWTYTDSGETNRFSGTIRFQVLKIYFDGTSSAPTLYLYSTTENTKVEKIN
jgi:hypothetical protein